MCLFMLLTKSLKWCILVLNSSLNVFTFKSVCPVLSIISIIYAGDTKISVSIKKTNANKCTLSEMFLTEILNHSRRFNSSKGQVIQNYNLPVECNNLNLESDQSEPLGHFFGKRHSPKSFRD